MPQIVVLVNRLTLLEHSNRLQLLIEHCARKCALHDVGPVEAVHAVGAQDCLLLSDDAREGAAGVLVEVADGKPIVLA